MIWFVILAKAGEYNVSDGLPPADAQSTPCLDGQPAVNAHERTDA